MCGRVGSWILAALLAGALLPQASAQSTATPAGALVALPGFKVELLRSALPGEGSWVCLAVDDKGRLLISPQAIAAKEDAGISSGGGLLRVTLARSGTVEKVERLATPVGAAMGLLHAFNGLYVNGQGPAGTGLYRLRDTDGDDQFDEWKLLQRFEGTARAEATGEHGPHGVVLGPDKMIYVINGNETKPPAVLRVDSPHKNFAEDQLLPPQLWPANFTWANGPPPGGYVARTDPDGREWTLICGGLRNAYDLAFNRDGEMFTFDSDMDWDDGSPWYRPTRVNHLVSGGEHGWRKGTGKWPDYYPDSLRSNLDLGRSSPTGMKFGAGTQFPHRYRRALFLCDWAFGTIYAAHLTPSGASYKLKAEKFLTGTPLNVTDLEFGPDGAMYFITGGRGTQSGLYRVTHTEPVLRDPVQWEVEHQDGLKARALRRKLETFHGRRDSAAVDFAWPHLDSTDRWLRHAARIAIEWQDVKLWQQRALDEKQPTAALTALLALARCGEKSAQGDLLESLGALDASAFSEEQTLDALRVLELACIRMGRPDDDTVREIVRRLDAGYPAKSEWVNRELCRLLVYFAAPSVIAKSLALLAAAPTQEEQMHYAFTLRLAKHGWTPALRTAYFAWFPKAAKNYKGSSKFLGFLADTRAEAAALLTDAERRPLAALLQEPVGPVAAAASKPRAFVKDWKMADLVPTLPQVGQNRSLARGKEAFAAAQCSACHRFGDEGGAIGPDLTAIASRFNRHDLLEAILLPSKVIPDQFQQTLLVTKAGDDITGRILSEDGRNVVVSLNPLTADRVIVAKDELKSRRVSLVSPMPEGTLNTLTQEEILDLIAWLESVAKPGK